MFPRKCDPLISALGIHMHASRYDAYARTRTLDVGESAHTDFPF